MPIPERFLDELTERSDIVDVVSQYVRLTKKSGANLFGLCPFHSEKTPSFSVSPDKQIYHCFGCGKGGGVINFIMEIENLSFKDAVAFLARRANMPMPQEADSAESSRRKRLLELNRDAARFFHARLVDPTGLPAQNYVNRRGISPAMVRTFGLGFAPDSWNALTDAMEAKGYTKQELFDAGLMKRGRNGGGYDTFRNRLMFPVIDVRGSVIGFSGRILGDGEPKYLNSPETPVFSKSHNLFALNLAKKSKSGYIILTEGNIDVVSLHQAGFDSAVASLGTSLTPEQARLISRYTGEVVLCYDSDEAGKKAAARGIGILEKLDLKVRVLTLPGAKDPDEYIKKNGPDAFRNLLESSANQVEYRLKNIESKYDINTQDGKVGFLSEAEQMLAKIPSDTARELYAHIVAEIVSVSPDAVLRDLESIRNKMIKSIRKTEEREFTQPTRNIQPKIKEFRYENADSALAEEGLVQLLFLDPGLGRNKNLPDPSLFFSPLLREFYKIILHRIQNDEVININCFQNQFSADEMSFFTSIIEKTVDLSNGEVALNDYINKISQSQIMKENVSREQLKKERDIHYKTKSYGG